MDKRLNAPPKPQVRRRKTSPMKSQRRSADCGTGWGSHMTISSAPPKIVIKCEYRNSSGEFAITATSTREPIPDSTASRSEEHTSELQSQSNLVCRLLLEQK